MKLTGILILGLTLIPEAPAAQLIASSGLFDAGTGAFYNVDTVSPANPLDRALPYVRTNTFGFGNPASLTGDFIANGLATYGTLETSISGEVSGSPSFPLITMYSSAFFFDTMTFTTGTTHPAGTAILRISVRGSGSVTDAPGDAGVYGRAYGGLLAGPAGSGLIWQYPDATNGSVNVVLSSQPIPFVSGVPVDVEVALGANLWIRCAPSSLFPAVCLGWSGSGSADFSHTAVLTGIDLFDSSGAPISSFDITSASGTFYGPNGVVPEPGSMLLGLAGMAVLAMGLRSRQARARASNRRC
jgi:hypothetical protein